MVEAHVGAWQLATFVAAQYGLDITSVYAPEENPYLKDFLTLLRAALPVHWISRDGCMRRLSKELRKGNMVGLATDTRSGSSERVDFFGVTIAANSSAARLALNNQCDLIPVHTERLEGRRFRTIVCKPIRPADPDAPTGEQVRQMTADLFKCFEAWIRADPAQWICFSRYFPPETYQDLDR
jgi:lauroyl/myristoyl acyltransferase